MKTDRLLILITSLLFSQMQTSRAEESVIPPYPVYIIMCHTRYLLPTSWGTFIALNLACTRKRIMDDTRKKRPELTDATIYMCYKFGSVSFTLIMIGAGYILGALIEPNWCDLCSVERGCDDITQ